MAKKLTSKKAVSAVNTNDEKNDVIGSRLLALLLVSVAYISILMFIYNMITGITNILLGFAAIQWMFYISAATLAAAVIFFIMRRAKKTDETLRVLTSSNILATAIVFFFASFLILKYDVHTIKVMYVLIPVWFIIYMIYTLYLREFLTVSVSSAVGMALLYVMYKISLSSAGVSGNVISSLKSVNIFLLVILIVICALMCVILSFAKRKNGKFGPGGKIHLASANAKYLPLYIPPIITAACLTASFFYSKMLIYGIFTLGGFWVVMIVYYTYTMMKK